MISDMQKTLNEVLEREVKEGRVYGVSAMVLHKGKEIYQYAYGNADEENHIPMKRDTIIRLYSMTKPITAVAVMILAERGLFDLRDSVSRYLPMFANPTYFDKDGQEQKPWREITIWDLLNMTSGIPYPDNSHESGRRMGEVFGRLIERRKNGEWVDTMEYMEEIAKVPLCFQPGDKWMYGLSADVLGALVEKVSGMRYGEFLKKEIFEPLDMKDTAFFVPEEKKERFAQIYLFNQELGRVAPANWSHLGEYYGEDVAFESGGAGLVSTLEDYSHFATMMIQKGVYNGKRIIGSRTVEFMTRDCLLDYQKSEYYNWESLAGYGYGCLMRVLKDSGQEAVSGNAGSFGWDGWTGNFVLMDPVDELVVLYFIQRGDTGTLPVIRKVRMVVGAALDDMQ